MTTPLIIPPPPERYAQDNETAFRSALQAWGQWVASIVGRLANPPSGFYTPTLFNTTNISASTAYTCQWLRVGNSITVSGKVDVTPSATVDTVLGISLPMASALSAQEQCAGTAAATQAAGEVAAVVGDTVNDRAKMMWVATVTFNHNMFFTFTYAVL